MVLNSAEIQTTFPRLLVVASSGEVRSLGVLRALDIAGAFDATMGPPVAFEEALRVVAAGGPFWSPTILRRLKEGGDTNLCLRCFTSLEQIVFAAIGDGTDDPTAAVALNLSPAAVSTLRRDLHRKLGGQHRG